MIKLTFLMAFVSLSACDALNTSERLARKSEVVLLPAKSNEGASESETRATPSPLPSPDATPGATPSVTPDDINVTPLPNVEPTPKFELTVTPRATAVPRRTPVPRVVKPAVNYTVSLRGGEFGCDAVALAKERFLVSAECLNGVQGSSAPSFEVRKLGVVVAANVVRDMKATQALRLPGSNQVIKSFEVAVVSATLEEPATLTSLANMKLIQDIVRRNSMRGENIPFYTLDERGLPAKRLVFVSAASAADAQNCIASENIIACPVAEYLFLSEREQHLKAGDAVYTVDLEGQSKLVGIVSGELFESQYRVNQEIPYVPYVIRAIQ